MPASVTATLVAFGAIFVAELGDKSQLIALAFATRARALPVVAGVAAAAVVVQGLSVAVGTALQAALPTDWLTVAAGVLFLAFALLAARGADGEGETLPTAPRGRSIAFAVATAFVLAELGDKTMVATIALAARGQPLATWVGAVAGMVLASGLAIAAGRWLGRQLPQRTLELASAVLFAVIGAALVVLGAVQLTR